MTRRSAPLLVIGDSMLDIDIEGEAHRLSPEAPVPVVDVARHWQRPGGAALAAILAARDTDHVVLVSSFGADDGGRALLDLLPDNVEVLQLPMHGNTVRKTRISAGGYPMLRVDSGDGRHIGPAPARLAHVLDGAGAVLIADYGHGVSDAEDIRRLLEHHIGRIPVVWDPHPRGPAPVEGTTLVTPNASEADRVAGSGHTAHQRGTLLREHWKCDAVAVTIGDRGALLTREITKVVPLPRTAITAPTGPLDTCGAGDRFASAAATALLTGRDIDDAVATAVGSAMRFVYGGGAVSVSSCGGEIAPAPQTVDAFALADQVRRRGGRLIATGGCFDLLHRGHVTLLRQARLLGDALIVCINSDRSVRASKGAGRPVVPESDRARVLLALEAVDAVIVFDEATPAEVLARLEPDVWVKGGDYEGHHLPESDAVVAGGGSVVIVPTVEGYSSTRLLQNVTTTPTRGLTPS